MNDRFSSLQKDKTPKAKKIIYIIPGFKHKPKNKAYQEIASLLKKDGYIPVPVYIPWKQTTISENTQYFLKQFKKRKGKKKYILGFSFGAMIAFLASTKVQVSGLILCSLSPYFKEDLIKSRKTRRNSITKKRYLDFLSLRSLHLARQIKARQTLMLYGKKEAKPLIRRVTRAYRYIPSKHKHLIPVKNTEHDIGSKEYLSTIHQAAAELN